jgi:hypothetical protein
MKKPNITESKDDSDERLARLIRDGIIRPSRGGVLPKSFFTLRLPRPKEGASAVAAVIAERREGR